MEDARIAELDDAAASYADIRDQRQLLTKDEHELKVLALELMRRHHKTIYRHAGIEIRVVAGQDDVKVRVGLPPAAQAPA
jgi:hypothetical protein